MRPDPPTLSLALHHQQGLAFNSPATELLYGGAAGGGKSHLMRAVSIFWSCLIPGLQTYLFRRTVGDLYKNHFEGPTSYFALLAPLTRSRHCRIVKNEIRFWIGSKIFLQHCQHEKDVENYRGYEFHVLLIDEATLFTERMYRYLRARLRMTDDFRNTAVPAELRDRFPRIVCGSNPGGPGHHFVKRNWIAAGPYVLHRAPDEADDDGSGEQPAGLLRQFIPARLTDNPTLNARQYAAALRGLGDMLLVRAMLDGDWSVVSGAMFGEVWREHLHTVEPFPIPADWPLWRAADDGFVAPFCCLWGTEDPQTKTIYVCGEVYASGLLPEHVRDRVSDVDRRLILMDEEGNPFHHNKGLAGLIDSAAFADTGQGAVRGTPTAKLSRGDSMNALGLRWYRARKWPGCRQHGWQDIHRRMAVNPRCPDKMPGLRIFTSCLNLIRTLPAAMRDKKDPEDIDDPDDHALDALRYLLQWKKADFRRAQVTG